MTSRDELLQAAKLLERQVLRQQRTIAQLKARIARLEGATNPDQLELQYLREELTRLNAELFAPSSEKRKKETPKDTPAEDQPAATPTRANGHGPTPQPALPTVEVRHELPEEERICPACGGTMEPMGSGAVVTEVINVVEVDYRVERHVRQKYRCRCEEAVVVAPGPVRLIPGGRYGLDFVVHVAEGKYLDHLPLERQVTAMARRGLEVTSQTLWDQIEALAQVLEPTYEALCRRVLDAEVVFVDETHWRLMGEREGTGRWWVWSVSSEELATYRILKSRSAKAAERVLGGYRGVIVADGYSAYHRLVREGPPGDAVTLAYCWAHVRRKFLQAEQMYPDLARELVERIGRLYEVERACPKLAPGMSEAEREEALAARLALRRERSRPVIGGLRDRAYELKPQVPERSSMGKALTYMLSLWQGLTVFLENPRVPLDNNHAERALRGVVVGRKNHYGSRSKRGTEVAALFYTLFESAKLSGVNPAEYVRTAARRALENPGTVTLPNALR